MSKLYLIIGGGGFIGRHLTRQLVASGEQLRVLDIIARPDQTPESVEWHRGSILDEDALKNAMQGVDTVFHLAALAHLGVPQTDRYEQVNTIGTENVIKAAKTHNVEHLLITSTEVILRDWQHAHPQALTVTDALPDISEMAGPYCRSKLKAEIIARDAVKNGQPITLLYPTVPVGAGDYNLTAPTAMIRQFLSAPPPAYLDCRLNLVPVEDVAKAHILAAAQPAGGRYMLGGEDVDMKQLLSWLAVFTQKKMPNRAIPYNIAALTAHISAFGAKLSGKAPLASVEGVRLAKHKVNVDSQSTISALNWKVGYIQDALMQTADWLVANQLL